MFQNLNDFEEMQINNVDNILDENNQNLDEKLKEQWADRQAIYKILWIKGYIY